MTSERTKTLEEIVRLAGDCLLTKKLPCSTCPFQAKCLTSITQGKFPPRNQRLACALDAIAREELLDDPTDPDEQTGPEV